MHPLLFRVQSIARGISFATIAAVIGAAAIHFAQGNVQAPVQTAGGLGPSDPLITELWHCQTIGTAAQNDPACHAAWGENRRRFFTYRAVDGTSSQLSSPSPTEGR